MRQPKFEVISNDIAQASRTSARNRPYAKTFDERRERILAAAWDLLAEREADAFSLAELSERSDVSLRTIYNAFTDKEGVIAQAVATHYRTLFTDILPNDNDSCLLEEALIMADRVATEISRVKGWSVNGVRMYFSHRTSSRIFDSLYTMPLVIFKSWYRSAEADRKRIVLFGKQEIERSFSNAQWALVNDWSTGRIDVGELSRGMKCNLLIQGMAFGTRLGKAEANRLADFMTYDV